MALFGFGITRKKQLAFTHLFLLMDKENCQNFMYNFFMNKMILLKPNQTIRTQNTNTSK